MLSMGKGRIIKSLTRGEFKDKLKKYGLPALRWPCVAMLAEADGWLGLYLICIQYRPTRPGQHYHTHPPSERLPTPKDGEFPPKRRGRSSEDPYSMLPHLAEGDGEAGCILLQVVRVCGSLPLAPTFSIRQQSFLSLGPIR